MTPVNPAARPIHDKDVSLLSPMERLEDSLVYLADSMQISQLPEQRIGANEGFIKVFKRYLKQANSFNYPCNKLKNEIVVLNAPDNSFRIYNWELMREGELRRYYGVIQLADASFIPLVDYSDQMIRGAEDSVLSGTKWYGCLYYNILKKNINNQDIYFLIGWNGNSLNSDKKVVEAFGFNSQMQSRFGAPLFNISDRGKRKTTNRFILEYQKGARVSLNVDPDNGNIIFDHTESLIGDYAKRYTYVPDGTYDGLMWNGVMWVMEENIVQIQDLKNGNAPIEKPIK